MSKNANPAGVEKEIRALAERGLAVLRLPAEEWEYLAGTRHEGRRFSLTFPHDVANQARARALVLIDIEDEPELRLGLVRSVQAVATLDSRVVFDRIRRIKLGPLHDLLDRVAQPTLRAVTRKLSQSELRLEAVSNKLRHQLVEILATDHSNRVLLRNFAAGLSAPARFEDARAMQQDALTLALRAFGANNGAATIQVTKKPSALGSVRLLEDGVVEDDARWIEGWTLAPKTLTGVAVFERGADRLQVFTANKRPLEELFGVDLIYLNEPRHALVMVQYKMLELKDEADAPDLSNLSSDEDVPEDASDWTVGINAQFLDEIARMEGFDRDVDPAGPYRLNAGAFFFKLVRREASSTSAGIMMSLGHLNQLLESEDAAGPRNGLRISYKRLGGHYLRGEVFVELLRSGYIGTRSATTDHLQALITATLAGGRAAVAAIQTQLPSAHRTRRT